MSIGRILSKILLRISPRETTFARRQFDAPDPAVQQHLETVGQQFVVGYHHALSISDPAALAEKLDTIKPLYRGFAFEGAGMALALLDHIVPGKKNRWSTFLAGPGEPHVYMMHVGAGWAAARIAWVRRRLEHRLPRYDRLLRWLVVDGYGFHQGYFDWEKFVDERTRPNRLSGYARRAFDQGLGRSLWFSRGACPLNIAAAITRFELSRQADLYSGVGLACAYAGGASRSSIEQLRECGEEFLPELAQGVAFAAKTRILAGILVEHTELACEILCLCDANEAALATDECLESLPEQSKQPAYDIWRTRIQKRFTSSTRNSAHPIWSKI